VFFFIFAYLASPIYYIISICYDSALQAIEENAIAKLISFQPAVNQGKCIEIEKTLNEIELSSRKFSSKEKENTLRKIFEALLDQGTSEQRAERKKLLLHNNSVFKRLGNYFLKNIAALEVGDKLWDGGESAYSMAILISGIVNIMYTGNYRAFTYVI
jgi:hypothetical protein